MVVEGLALNKIFTPHPKKKVITEIITEECKSSKIKKKGCRIHSFKHDTAMEIMNSYLLSILAPGLQKNDPANS